MPDLGSTTLSLLGRRVAELATCELLLLANFPSWFPVLPMYFLSYFADSTFPLFKPLSPLVRRIRIALSRSFGLRILATRPFASFRFYCDLDSIYLIAAEFLKGETSRYISSRDKVFLDIGAHYGLVSARIASSAGRSSRVIAIEPHPANYSVLKSNIELNQLSNVTALNFAVANFTGTSRMLSYDNVSARYKLVDEEGAEDSPFEVQCYLLQDVFEKFGIDHVDLAKMDIEGQELRVLQSCFPLLADRIGKLDIEVHHHQDLAPLQDLLSSNGFVVQVESTSVLSRSYRIIAEKTP
jgi:FkbM family methyltransferase